MNIRDIEHACIVDIARNALSQKDVCRIKTLYKKRSHNVRMGLDMRGVRCFDSDFYSFMKDAALKSKLSLFNLENELFLQLFVSGSDSLVNLYLNENDFLRDKRLIVNRRFRLLKTA